MENVAEILPNLTRVAREQRNGAMLFSYQFKGLTVRGVFFGGPQTLTIGISDKNVGWQCDLSGGSLSERIPEEVYKVIRGALVNEEGTATNKPFFLKLKSVLEVTGLAGDVRSPTEEEIKALLRSCKTKDRKYDKDGEKPFFDHWRRVRASSESLGKIQRYFGRGVREECYRNRVTAVWASEPKDKSLQFLNPDSVAEDILAAARGQR